MFTETFTDRDAHVADDNRQPTSQRTREIADRLTEIRQRKVISQRDFCDQLGISQPLMSHYERGERRIPSDLLAEMAEILGVSSDVLLGLRRSAKRNGQELSPDMKRLWKKFQQVANLPDHDRRAVIRLINSVAKAKAKS